MTIDTKTGKDLARVVAMIVVFGLIVAGALWWLLRQNAEKHFTALFPNVVGLYQDNDVRVLGVHVGHVARVTPKGDLVEVELVVDSAVRVPADAKAVIVAPSLVSDRYVQLTPAFTGGPELTSGTVIQKERTAAPLEIDDLYASLSRVSTTLGPNGVNRDGALSDLLNTLAKNLDGNGQAVNTTVTDLSKLSSTLSGNAQDLFATIDNLQKFSTTLAGSDQQVRQFNAQLAEAAKFLAGERTNLAAAVDQLGIALGSVQTFINDNRGKIKSNVDKLATITQVLVDQRAALAETLDVAPLALSNLVGTYNGSSGTLDTRSNLNELTQPPIVTLCNLVRQGTPKQLPATLADACNQLAPVVQGLVPLPSPAQVIDSLRSGKLPTLPLPMAGTPLTTGGTP